MLIVKLSTAATIEIGPVLDSTGVGVEYSGLAITELRLVKNGTGAAMASPASITYVANGHYTLVMTTGNTDTLGTLTVSCHKVGYQMPRAQMMVVPVKVYDSIVAGSDNLEVDAIQLLNTAILTPAVAGTLDVNAKQFGGATVNATTSVTIPASSTLATTAGAVGSVTAVSTGAITAASFAAGAIDASAIATDAIGSAEISAAAVTKIQSGLATPTNITAGTITTVSAVTGLTVANLDTTVSSRASQTSLDTLDDLVDTEVAAIKTKTDQLTFTVANQVDSNSLTIGANVITASALATDAVNEIADQVWDELLSGHTGAGSTGAGLSSASSAGDPWSTALPGSYGAGTAGKIVGDNVNATISSRASQTSLDTLDDLVDTEVGAIKTKTDQLTFTIANQVDSNSLTIGANAITASALATDAVNEIQSGLATPTNITAASGIAVSSIGANVITASALATDAVNEIADQVWDELLSGHTTSGSTGAGLTSASSAGDPWSTALPGSYGAGTAGKIVGDNVNATISSRASQTSLDTLDDLVDTEVGAIKTKTDQLTFTIANQVDSNSLTIGANAITASALATDAVNEIQSGLATPTNITAASGIVLSPVTHTGARIPNVTLTDTATNLTNAATAGDLTATMKSSVTTAVPTVSQTADQVWDELLSGHTTGGSTGAGLTSASSAGDPWSTVIPASYGAGTAGKILGDNVNATISSRASQTSLDTLDDYVDTEVAAIKTKTDQMTFTVANQIDSNALTNGGMSASATRSALGLATNNLDSQISGLATPTNITSASGIAVSSIGANVITASALATDAVSEIQSGLATPTNITAASGIAVSSIGANVVTASALATDAVNEIQSGLATPTNITAATGIVLSPVTHTGARIPNVTLVDTTTNLTNAPTAGDLTATMKASVTAAVPTAAQNFAAVLTTALTESYAADGSAPTLAQAILLIQQSLHEFSIAGTTRTVKKLDNSTTAAVFTLDSATAPTSTTRSS